MQVVKTVKSLVVLNPPVSSVRRRRYTKANVDTHTKSTQEKKT
jgi:hypothetical protein